MRNKFILLLVLLVCCTMAIHPQNHSVCPGRVWLDTNGKPIQAHGFQILYQDGVYYWYGENKEFTKEGSNIWTYGIRCYTSTDFYNWKDCGLIIEPDTVDFLSTLHYSQTLDRPHILYCKKTKKYVAWIKNMDVDGFFVILQADRFLGPYKFIRNIRPEGFGVGDFEMYADEKTDKGYVWFERPHWELICAELTDDYTNVTNRYSSHISGIIPPYTREAPAHFVYNGKHYLFTSGTSGYWPNPSKVHTFSKYHGKYKDLGDPCPTDETHTTFCSQITDVVKIAGKKDLYVAVADRWEPEYCGTDRPQQEQENTNKYFLTHKPNPMPRDFSEITIKDKRSWKRSKNDATYKSTYVFLPIIFKNGKPEIEWRDEWRIEDYQ